MTKFVRINLYEFYDRNSRPIDRAAQFLARIKQEFGNELNLQNIDLVGLASTGIEYT